MQRARPLLVVALVVLGSTAYWFAAQSGDDSPTESAAAVAHPPAGTGESPRRLLPAVPAPPAPEGSFVFLHDQADKKTPVAFDPCRPIHYVVNAAGAPVDGAALVADAIAAAQRATGLKFVDDGATSEVEQNDRAPYQPDRYRRDRWAPVLVSWADEQQFSTLAGYITGAARPQGITTSGQTVYVSGSVVLDRVDLSPEHMPDRALARATIMHELGHLVGLDHTADRSQLMFSEAQLGHTDYASGDLHGLAVLGAQRCFPDV
jgi:hypothetical protein